MTLFDDVVKELYSLLESYKLRHSVYNSQETWPDAGRSNFVLTQDMAFELGGSRKPLEALGVSIATADESLVRQNENLLLGNELSELNEDSPYARVSLCLVDEKKIGQGENLFNAIKTINYTRYHFNPEGFMMRISSANKRESVRISKESILKGLSFEKAGNLLIREFLKNPHVLKVKNIFINLKEFEYKKLEALINRTELIVKTIDHIAETSIMDCASCGLKKVCDEVEEIKELHFKKQFQS